MIFITNYESNPDWVKDYTDDYFLFDRSLNRECVSTIPKDKIRFVPNIGSDNYDRFVWIVENYENLPDVVHLVKGNLFKYITREEYEAVKDNKNFTPLLTMNHPVTKGVSYYADNIYWEKNNGWFLEMIPAKTRKSARELSELLGISKMEYFPFAPGCNYILSKEDILKHPKSFYQEVLGYLDWHRWPAEAAVLERGLYTLWK